MRAGVAALECLASTAAIDRGCHSEFVSSEVGERGGLYNRGGGLSLPPGKILMDSC